MLIPLLLGDPLLAERAPIVGELLVLGDLALMKPLTLPGTPPLLPLNLDIHHPLKILPPYPLPFLSVLYMLLQVLPAIVKV